MSKDKIKVIQMIPHICEAGAETLVKDYALHLNKKRFDVFILTTIISPPDSSNLKLLKEEQIEVLCPYDLSFFSIHKRIVRRIIKLFFPKYDIIQERKRYDFVKHSILHLKPDVIHVHMQMLKYLSPISDSLRGVKLFYTCHSLPERYFSRIKEKEEYEAASVLIRKNGLKLIALHDEMRIELNNMFGVENTIVLRNGVDFKKFKNIHEERAEIRKSLNIPADTLVLGHVGRFIYIKNHKYILEIFKRLISIHPSSYLLLVGEGETKKEIEIKIKEYKIENKCLILPPQGDIPRLLKAMDVFVLPSLFEGVPIVAIEAQLSGLRLLISNRITKDVLFSENAIPLDINDDPMKWVDTILNTKIKGTIMNNINEYNIDNVITKVEKLYISD